MTRPRVLLVTPIRPSLTGNGLAMRVSLFVEAIETFADLHIVVVPLGGQPVGARMSLRPTTTMDILDVSIDKAYAVLERIASEQDRLAAFRIYGKPSLCGRLSQGTLDHLARLTASRAYDLVHLSRSYLLPVARAIDEDTLLSLDLDEDDAASTLTSARRALDAGFAFRAAWLQAEASAFDRLISRGHSPFAASFVSNESDRASLKARHRGLDPTVVPNAVTFPRVSERRDDGGTIAFVGSLSYEPNVDGLIWFMSEIVPRLRCSTSRPFKILIAGAHPSPTIVALGERPGVKVISGFKNAADIYRRATIAIAPMRTGGGLRTKIIEAAAYGVVCIAHRSCATALPPTALWTAGTAAAFAEACADALENVGVRRQREHAAKRFAKMHHDRTSVVAKLAARLASLIDRRAELALSEVEDVGRRDHRLSQHRA